MENLSYAAKIAVLKVLNDIVYADNVVNEKEVAYLSKVAEAFGVVDSYQEELPNCVTLQALSEIKTLSPIQKERIAKLMGEMIVVDGDINYNEVKFYNEVCDACHIEQDFHTENYPDATHSGPFVNPEDV